MDRVRSAAAGRTPGKYKAFATPEVPGSALSETGKAVVSTLVVYDDSQSDVTGLPKLALDSGTSGTTLGSGPARFGAASSAVYLGYYDEFVLPQAVRVSVYIGGAATTNHARVSTGRAPLAGGPSGASGVEYATEPMAYNPGLTNVTTGNGTVTGQYIRFGKRVEVWGRFALGSTSSVTGTFQADVPYLIDTGVTPAESAIGEWAAVIAGTRYGGVTRIQSSTALRFTIAAGGTVSNTAPAAWANGDTMSWHVTYITNG